MAEPKPRPRKPAAPASRRVLRKLSSKYRLLLINDNTFEERFSLRLSRINVILVALAAFSLCAAVVTTVIVFTPLKKYIPGYADIELTRYSYRSTLLADSLARVVPMQQQYIDNLLRVLRGDTSADSIGQLRPVTHLPTAEDLEPSSADSVLRQRVRQQEAYSVNEEQGTAVRKELAGIFFFPPLRGLVTQTFDRAKEHLGVDIVTKADEAVKACLDGTVIIASWTTDGGHVIQVQHANDLVSVYKHNAVLLKKTGDRVKAGEAIAIVGDSGELTSGPHLHFELWLGGEPIDPEAYMVFK